MSGFLHRLAVRTLGLAPQIRPRAALPYAAPSADFPEAELTGRQVAADPASSGADAARPPRHPQPLPEPLLATPPAVEAAASSSPAHPLRVTETMPPFTASNPNEVVGPELLRLALETPEPVRHIAAASRDESPPRFGDLDAVVDQLLRGGKEGKQKAMPPGLVPPRIAAAADVGTIRTQASRERALSRTPAAAPEAAPEVHITIGRLEVNPPSRPPPPPPPPARGPAPLSLSDYLARRNGGRS